MRRGSDDRTGVMNCQCRPQPELRLREVQREADHGKCKQRDGVQREDGAKRDGHVFIAGFCNGSDSRDGAAAADRRAAGDEEGSFGMDGEYASEQRAEQDGRDDADGGVDEAGSSNRERSRLSVAKGCGSRRPKAMPAASATAGDTKPLAEMMIERKKMRLALTGLTSSSVQRKRNELQAEIVMPDKVSLSARRRPRAMCDTDAP